MKILAIDSSGLVASVAVVEDDVLQGEYTINFKRTHSEVLLPMLDALKRDLQLDLQSIDAIAVAAGPGSFTGLRIGSATAKGLGLALGKPIVPVPTVDALAYNLYGSAGLICPLMDARRNQTYTGLYRFTEDGIFETVIPQKVCAIEEIIEDVNRLGEAVVLLGDGVPVFREAFSKICRVPVDEAPAHVNKQRAGAVASLGLIRYKEGKAESAADHRPEYLRLSQAERERKERLAREAAENPCGK